MKTIKERIDEGLALRGITPAQLARAIGVNEGTIANYRAGRYEPKQKRIEEIANALGVTVEWLMGADVPETDKKQAEINEYLDELKNRSEMRMLFSVTKDATKEEIEQAVKIIMALRGNNDE